MNRTVNLLFIALITFLLTDCRNTDDQNDMTSGTIEYKIRYLNGNLNDSEAALLPNSMELIFNKDLAVHYIDGFLGLYQFNTITNFHSKKCSTFLKVFDKQYLYKGKRGEKMCCFDDMKDMEIHETNETKIIGGLTCRHAEVSLPSSNEKFDVYYTTEISLRNPNQNNPYNKIDGVLMQFELQLFHLRMEFSAVRFKPNGSKGSKLTVSEKTMEVTRDQMTQILNKLIE